MCLTPKCNVWRFYESLSIEGRWSRDSCVAKSETRQQPRVQRQWTARIDRPAFTQRQRPSGNQVRPTTGFQTLGIESGAEAPVGR